MMKTTFYFILKVLFLLKVFKFLFNHFGDVEKGLDWKPKVYFKMYDVKTLETNNCNASIDQYLKKYW